VDVLYLNRILVRSAKNACDVGEVNGGKQAEQIKDNQPLLPVT
jgi:hypothetical protein